MDYSRPFEVLSKWAHSRDFWNLYQQLTEEFQGSQSVGQLALIMTTLMVCRRLLYNFLDHSDQPIKGSHLTDLDAILRGESLGNSGRVAE